MLITLLGGRPVAALLYMDSYQYRFAEAFVRNAGISTRRPKTGQPSSLSDDVPRFHDEKVTSRTSLEVAQL